MKLDEPNHSVSTVITAPHQQQALFQFCTPRTASSSNSWPFVVVVVLFRTKQREKRRSSTATT